MTPPRSSRRRARVGRSSRNGSRRARLGRTSGRAPAKPPRKSLALVGGKQAPAARRLGPAGVAAAQFGEVARLIEEARRRAIRAVNVELIELYWKIGAVISRRIECDGWGKGTVQELSSYLSRTQRGARGFSPQNLWRMRQFFETYRETPTIVPLVKELPWSANLHILSGTRSAEEREFYLRMTIERGWNVRELARQLSASAFERSVLGSPKLSTVLRELHPGAAEDFKEVYSLEFLDLPEGHAEAELHGALLHNLGRFITELGRDFCFVGSQYSVQVGNQDFAIDLLFFHRGLSCLVALELKVREFRPEDLGKLSFYLEALDRDVKKPHERASIGVLLCATKDNEVVEYALGRTTSPALVAEYETVLPSRSILRRKLQELYTQLALAEGGTEPSGAEPAARRGTGKQRRRASAA